MTSGMKSSSRRVRVKVCGITRAADAEILDDRNVDFLGFNFYTGSRRFIDPGAAARIITGLKNAEPVGVFVDATPERIAEVSVLTGIRWVQLHGNESWETLEKISLPVIKAIPQTRLDDFGGLRNDWTLFQEHLRYFLVDTLSSGEFGGSGKPFDWSLLRSNPLPRPFFLAGGLGPENLKAALAATEPFAVDLNSKVETAPGLKDIGLVEQCLRIVAQFNKP